MSNSLLDLPFVLETRRNHALEHATLHILSDKYPKKPMAGHSNPTGFVILGDVTAEEVQSAVDQALNRLNAGESGLAIHPGCGTNLATSGLMAGTFAWFVLRGGRSTFGKMMRLPFAIAFGLLGFALSKPLGPMIQQRVTTDAQLGGLHVTDIRQGIYGRMRSHRVVTRNA